MPQFTTRMVLHNADWNDYTQLADEMAQRGFIDEITDSDGGVWEMPDGEYYGTAATKSGALEIAKASAAACGFTVAPTSGKITGRQFGAFVTASAGWTATGLKKLR